MTKLNDIIYKDTYEKQRSPAITCHPTIPPYLRKEFLKRLLRILGQKNKNQNTDVNVRTYDVLE